MDSSSSSSNQESMRTPTEGFFDFFSSIISLVQSMVGDKINVSSAAWKSFTYLLFLLIVYYFRDPIFTDYFWYIIDFLIVLLSLELVIRNWDKIKKTFRGIKNLHDIEGIGVSESSLSHSFTIYSIETEDLPKLISLMKKKRIISQSIIQTIIENQQLTSKTVKELLKMNLSSDTTLKLLRKSVDLLDEEDIKKVFDLAANDTEIKQVCILTQTLAADLAAKQNILKNERGISQKIRELRPTERKESIVVFMSIVLSAIITLTGIYLGQLLIRNETMFITTDGKGVTTIIMTHGVVLFVLSVGSLIVCVNLSQWAYKKYIRWKLSQYMQ